MRKFQSTKLIEGFSTVFRQHGATETHCSKLHGYAISFKVTFEAEVLDKNNWVLDFGFQKRSKTYIYGKSPYGSKMGPFTVDSWFKNMFDHTVVLAENDPELPTFFDLHDKNVIDLRILPAVGMEMFAKFVADELNWFLYRETDDRVRVVKVECFEHSKNSAIYIP